ncbi:transcriptional regulator [archaeon]|jgi:uncharacterized protein|nr:transcriptional regulator [archaeon]MBT4352621.1 transcriptional regulator [archaeon]MBT4648252.1 transcriptional regulator [archaeon]MBT6820867.1 transcriptional regulator [archaeon]MBT7392720.1 transcriptional regulator [archaeon]
MNILSTPQEVEVWVIIPAIRSRIAKNLSISGLKYREIAKFLDITIPAVSQYINDKRAKKIKFSKEVEEIIKTSSEKIMQGESTIRYELQKILSKIKEKKETCVACGTYSNTKKDCDICY